MVSITYFYHTMINCTDYIVKYVSNNECDLANKGLDFNEIIVSINNIIATSCIYSILTILSALFNLSHKVQRLKQVSLNISICSLALSLRVLILESLCSGGRMLPRKGPRPWLEPLAKEAPSKVDAMEDG